MSEQMPDPASEVRVSYRDDAAGVQREVAVALSGEALSEFVVRYGRSITFWLDFWQNGPTTEAGAFDIAEHELWRRSYGLSDKVET